MRESNSLIIGGVNVDVYEPYVMMIPCQSTR